MNFQSSLLSPHPTYGRRFIEAADLAYPEPQGGRNEDQNRLLLWNYMKGLRDRHIVERLVREGRPDTFAQAMRLVQEYEADDYRLHLALDEAVEGRHKEPMEVNAFSRPSKPSSTSPK